MAWHENSLPTNFYVQDRRQLKLNQLKEIRHGVHEQKPSLQWNNLYLLHVLAEEMWKEGFCGFESSGDAVASAVHTVRESASIPVKQRHDDVALTECNAVRLELVGVGELSRATVSVRVLLLSCSKTQRGRWGGVQERLAVISDDDDDAAYCS